MAVPQQKAEILIPALAEYLAANTDVSDWTYYSDIAIIGDPRGAIAMPSNTGLGDNIMDGIPSTWRFSIKLLIGSSSENDLIKLPTRWFQYVRDDVMRSLWQTGYTTTIDTVTLTRAFKGIRYISGVPMKPTFNQDGGGFAAVYWTYEWRENTISNSISF